MRGSPEQAALKGRPQKPWRIPPRGCQGWVLLCFQHTPGWSGAGGLKLTPRTFPEEQSQEVPQFQLQFPKVGVNRFGRTLKLWQTFTTALLLHLLQLLPFLLPPILIVHVLTSDLRLLRFFASSWHALCGSDLCCCIAIGAS